MVDFRFIDDVDVFNKYDVISFLFENIHYYVNKCLNTVNVQT